MDNAWHCLLLLPVFYRIVCHTLLDKDELIDHDPLGGDNVIAQQKRYSRCLEIYYSKFNEIPPSSYWPSPTRAESGRLHSTADPNIKRAKTNDFSTQSTSEEIAETTINIMLREPSGKEVVFRVKRSTYMGKVMDTYANRKGVCTSTLRFFSFDLLMRLKRDDTVAALDLKDGDIIDVSFEVGGC